MTATEVRESSSHLLGIAKSPSGCTTYPFTGFTEAATDIVAGHDVLQTLEALSRSGRDARIDPITKVDSRAFFTPHVYALTLGQAAMHIGYGRSFTILDLPTSTRCDESTTKDTAKLLSFKQRPADIGLLIIEGSRQVPEDESLESSRADIIYDMVRELGIPTIELQEPATSVN